MTQVIAASISAALSNGSADGVTASASTARSVELPLGEIKRRLMAEGQDTWGTESELRTRFNRMFATQVRRGPPHILKLRDNLTRHS